MTNTRENIKAQVRGANGRVIGDSPLTKITNAVNDAFVSIRAKHPDVPNVQLVVGATGKRAGGRSVHGHFAPQSWVDDKVTHEIIISGESLGRGAVEVMGTLLHESAHSLCEVRGIKDTSRQGRYHNARFRAAGEELGIELEHDKRIGWSLTTLPPETVKLYKEEIAAIKKSLSGYRREKVRPLPAKTTVKISCECRKVTVPISFFEQGDLKCLVCKKLFTEEGVDDAED